MQDLDERSRFNNLMLKYWRLSSVERTELDQKEYLEFQAETWVQLAKVAALGALVLVLLTLR